MYLWRCIITVLSLGVAGTTGRFFTKSDTLQYSEHVFLSREQFPLAPDNTLPGKKKRVFLDVCNSSMFLESLVLMKTQFDGLSTNEEGFGLIKYHSKLRFTEFTVVNFDRADDYLRRDDDCATSNPNALIGTQWEKDSQPRFTTENAYNYTNNGLFFDVNSLSIKPLSSGYPDDVKITLTGWKIRNLEVVKYIKTHITFRGRRFYPVDRLDLKAIGWAIQDVNVLEITAVRGATYKSFCVDDIELDFNEIRRP